MYDWAFLKNKVERWWLYIFLFIKKKISHLKRSRQERYFAYAKNLIQKDILLIFAYPKPIVYKMRC